MGVHVVLLGSADLPLLGYIRRIDRQYLLIYTTYLRLPAPYYYYSSHVTVFLTCRPLSPSQELGFENGLWILGRVSRYVQLVSTSLDFTISRGTDCGRRQKR
jgi:hypothetical protein